MKKHILKKTVSLLIAAIMLLSLSVPISATTAVIDADAEWEGTGEETSPYLIQTEAELLGFAENIGETKTNGKYFKLTKDLDMNPNYTGTSTAPTNLWPYKSTAFTGTFDGAGHTISGICLQKTSDDNARTGIFGGATVAGASLTIKNLSIVNSYVAGNKWGVGGLVGAGNGSGTTVTLSNLYVDVNVSVSTASGDDCGGGMIGSVENSTTNISNCVYAGDISAARGQRVGGFIGDTKQASTRVSIETSAFYGNITTNRTDNAQYISGFIGVATSTPASLTVDNCIGAGSISFSGTFSNSGNFLNNSNGSAVLSISNSLFVDMLNQNKIATVTTNNNGNITTNNVEVVATDLQGSAANSKIDTSKWIAQSGTDYPLPASVYAMKYKTAYVGYQTKDSGENYSIRLLGVLGNDDLDAYSNIGFNVTLTYNGGTKELNKEITTVYSSINQTVGNNSVKDSAEDLGGQYIFALNINNIPDNLGDMTVTVSTYYVLADTSVQVPGNTSTFIVAANS